MAAITAFKKKLLNRMNGCAQKVKLGDLLANNVIASGVHTSAGGDATESITVTGAASGDIAIVTLKTAGATPRTITTAVATTDAITVTMSGDPSTDHVLQYIVVRAV